MILLVQAVTPKLQQRASSSGFYLRNFQLQKQIAAPATPNLYFFSLEEVTEGLPLPTRGIDPGRRPGGWLQEPLGLTSPTT